MNNEEFQNIVNSIFDMGMQVPSHLVELTTKSEWVIFNELVQELIKIIN